MDGGGGVNVAVTVAVAVVEMLLLQCDIFLSGCGGCSDGTVRVGFKSLRIVLCVCAHRPKKPYRLTTVSVRPFP